MTIDVLCLPGTFQPQGEPISDAFMRGLNRDKFNPVYVEYPASYGTPLPYADSRQGGYDSLLAAAQARFPNPVHLYGYSQGAWGAGKLAQEHGLNLTTGVNIVGCALMADPERPHSKVPVLGPSVGYGISGERDITDVPTWWAAVENDPITSLGAGNPMRLIADLSLYYSIDSPEAVLRWFEQMMLTALARSLQPFWHPDHWRDWNDAFDALLNYAIRGRHTDAYVNEGHALCLAEAMNDNAIG